MKKAMKILVLTAIFGFLFLSFCPISNAVIVGNNNYGSGTNYLSRWVGGVKNEYMYGIQITLTNMALAQYIYAYLQVYNQEHAKCCIYDSSWNLIDETEEELVTSTGWWRFDFLSELVLDIDTYYIMVYGDAPNTDPGDVAYLGVQRTVSTGKNSYFQAVNNYGTWPDPASVSTSANVQTSIYLSARVDSTPVPLGTGKWDLVSLPVNQTVSKYCVSVVVSGTKYSWNQSVTNGYIMNDTFGWDKSLQQYTINTSFVPYDGFWMYFYDVSYKIWINTSLYGGGSGSGGTTTVYDNKTIPVNPGGKITNYVIGGGLTLLFVCPMMVVFMKKKK